MRDIGHFIKSILQDEKLVIADVGATGGPEVRWKKWENLCFFYTFDPDVRAKPWSCPSKNYPIGLWSHRCTQTLHLASYPPASSLFRPNQELISPFSARSAMQEVGTRSIELDTLDHTLAGRIVDFIKIDAEGAELEILKGAKETLCSKSLGLQLEALFCPIRHNVPIFADLDSFIRNFDFQLFQIQREHWIRKNNVSTFESAPQLIWGNVLYLLSKKSFLKRLQKSPDPQHLFAKYILIVLAYNLYDYAYELCEEVNLEEAKKLKEALGLLSASKREVFKLMLSLSAGVGKYALAFSKKSKKHRLSYIIRKVRQLGSVCLYLGKNDFALYD
jgi:Methyltransferase FkbM domain